MAFGMHIIKFYEMPEYNIYLVEAWCMTSTALGIEHTTMKSKVPALRQLMFQ